MGRRRHGDVSFAAAEAPHPILNTFENLTTTKKKEVANKLELE